MSEYYLADQKAAERDRHREREENAPEQPRARDIKATLLGDFLSPAAEPQGCDPYNSAHGKAIREPWGARRDRR